MSRIIFHLDMDAFYASIEQRDYPELKGKAVIVGAPPTQRGVVCAASYEARKFGVRSAMPSATAKKLCPDGIFVSPRMETYRNESEEIMRIVSATSAAIEQVSIDEAYLQLPKEGDTDGLLYEAVPLAKALKAQISQERNLTASIGIASNKFLAKLASDFQKPNGLTLIPDRDKVEFLRPLSVRVIPGVGKVTEQILEKAGLATLADLQDTRLDLRSLVGSFGPELKGLARGEDDRPVDTSDEVKSISNEETFDRDTDDRAVLRRFLREASEDIGGRLRGRGLAAHTVQVKVRYGDFTTLTRQMSLQDSTSDAAEIYRVGCYLLGREKLVRRPLRLLGLGVSGLGPATFKQLAFW